MTSQSLKNKKIIISAGASGIGLAITKICLEKGATVFVSDINEKFINKIDLSIKTIRPFLNYMSEILTTDENGESII